jgi:subtilisin family serine protease
MLTGLLVWAVAGGYFLSPPGAKRVLAGPPANSRAPHASKISDDLREAIQKNPHGLIPVVITAPSKPNNGLWGAILSGGGGYNSFNRVPMLAAKLPGFLVNALAARQDVVHIALDRPTRLLGHLETTTGAAAVRYGFPSSGPINGSGIGIAILDSGIDSAHHSFGAPGQPCRVIANVDFTGEGTYNDLYGHGTHVASIAAGSGHVAGGAYTGIAPGANLINVRVLGAQGAGSASATIAGIDWCIQNMSTYNIKVLNLSLGTPAVDSEADDPICQAVQQAVAAGLVVCAAAGNNGKLNGNKVYGGIHSPGICRWAITVGATNTFGTDDRSDDGICSYSSRGPTRGYYTDTAGVKHYDNLIKPDLVAPGNKIIEAESPSNYLLAENPALNAGVSTFTPHEMMYMSGTSMATPAVAGAAALMLQVNPALSPNMIKAILEYTAQTLAGFNTLEQGAGQLNIEGAVRLAGQVRSDFLGQPLGGPLLNGVAPTQMTTIAGYTFQWSGGIIQKWNFVTGLALITSNQGVYGTGVALGDGVILSNAVLLTDATLLSDGVIASDGVVTSDGMVLADGVLVEQGATLADGTLFADGVVIGDGVVVSDAVLLCDATLANAMAALDGEPGAMSVSTDDNIDP